MHVPLFVINTKQQTIYKQYIASNLNI